MEVTFQEKILKYCASPKTFVESNRKDITGCFLSRAADRIEIRTTNNNTIEWRAHLWMEATKKYHYYERVRGAYLKELNPIVFLYQVLGK